MELSLTPVGGLGGVLVAAAVLVLLVALVRPAGERVAAGRRRVLAALRLGAVALLLLAMLRPAVVHSTIERQRATLVVLADQSRSMQVADSASGRSRWQELVAALDDARPALERLGRDVEIKQFTFDEQLHPVESHDGRAVLPARPEGQQTALGAALDDLLKRTSGERLLGVIVLSDGAQRARAPRDLPPHAAARRLADLGFRLDAVVFGQARGPGQGRDVAIEELQTAERVFVKNRLPVHAVVRLDGFAQEPVTVQLLVETSPGTLEVVGSAPVEAATPVARVPIDLEHLPEAPGEFKLSVRVEPREGELVTTNNTASTFVTVLRGGVNVLYLEGAARVEQKFLRRSLDLSPDIRVDALRIDARRPETRPADLAERLRPGKYDVYLLGDLDSSAWQDDELDELAATVEAGAGLMMLGGFHSFGPGGYGQTPLADVLPIRIDRLERQRFGEPVRADLHLATRPRMRPTAAGLTQSLMLLAPRDQNASAWAALPPLEGANRFAGLKPGAVVLAESENAEPLLVAKDYGRGRVLAFAGDSTWRWWLLGHDQAHRRFWRQTVLWLARKDETHEGQVGIVLDRRRYAAQSRVEFALVAESPEGEPLADVRFTAEALLPDGRKLPLPLRRDGERTTGALTDTTLPGDYTLEARAELNGAAVGTARARFLVEEQDLELDNPAADRSALEGLAALTGGETLAPEQLPRLLERLGQDVESLEVTRQTRTTLWDTWPMLLSIVGLLVVEWTLRKRWNLV